MSLPMQKEEVKIPVLRTATLADRVYADLMDRKAHPELRRFISMGLKDWDRVAGGLSTWYVVVAGAQKMGKTILLGHARKQIAYANKSHVYFSLEMDDLMMGTRIYADFSGLEQNKYRDLDFTPEEWHVVKQTHDQIAAQTGYWNFNARTLEMIDKVVAAVDPDFVIVDYLGLVKAGGKWNKRYDEIGEISRHFKAMCLPKESDTEEDMIIRQFEDSGMQIDLLRPWLGDENVTIITSLLSKKQGEYVAAGAPPSKPRRRGLLTAVQTSKEMQRMGRLDQTAPKDSNAPFEDCDLGIVINSIPGYDGEPVPYMREISFQVSRVCAPDSFPVGINTALSRIYDNPEQETVKTNIVSTYGF